MKDDRQMSLIKCHTRENNPESEAHLTENLAVFSAQCQKVLDLMLRGAKLSVYGAMVSYGISSLPRRILDLKQAGVEGIEDSWIKAEGKKRHKVYFIRAQH